ncbi:MAG: cysteine-rich small domain-containing protein [Clostridia bacterium]|nr:cysteine-rich small domain-containing protein [Clostridia bacterium]
MEKKYTYFKNTECEYFPCHKTEGEDFNCLFCYCPLYALGDKCGGNFVFDENGIKDCSNCLIPHSKNGYDHITSRTGEISELIKKNRKK